MTEDKIEALRDALISIDQIARANGIPLVVQVRFGPETVARRKFGKTTASKPVGSMSNDEVAGLVAIQINVDV